MPPSAAFEPASPLWLVCPAPSGPVPPCACPPPARLVLAPDPLDPAFPRGCVFAGVGDDTGRIVAPRGDSVVRGGTSVILVAQREDIGKAVDFLTRVA